MFRSRGFLKLALLLVVILAGLFLRSTGQIQSPYGLNDREIGDIRILKSIQQGDMRVFYSSEQEIGRESLFHLILAPIQSFLHHPKMGFMFLSVWVSGLTLALLYAAARRIAGPVAAIVATSVLSLGFTPILLSRSIGRETLLAIPVLVTVLLLFGQPEVNGEGKTQRIPNRARLLLLSATLGFSLYLHPIAIHLLLAFLLFIFLTYWRRRERWQNNWPYVFFCLALLVIIALPYLFSSLQEPRLSGISRWLSSSNQNVLSLFNLTQIVRNFTSLFSQGAQDVTINIPGRPLLDPIAVILVFLGMVVSIRRWRKLNFQLLLLTSSFVAIPALLAQPGPSFLAYAPVLPLLALYLAVGVEQVFQHFSSSNQRTLFCLLASGWVLVSFLATQRALLIEWPSVPDHAVAHHHNLQELAGHLDATANNIPSVVCTMPSRSAPQLLNDADIIQLMLTKEDLPIRYADCRDGLILAGGGERQQYLLTREDDYQLLPNWFQEWLVERGAFQEIGDDASFSLRKSVIAFDVADRLDNLLGGFMTTRPLRYPNSIEETVGPAIRYGGNLTFLGYEFVGEEPYLPGDEVTIDLFWRADGSVPADIHIFLHLLLNEADPSQITAQVDTVSVTPESLRARDIWVHRVHLQLPETIPSGSYRLSLGAYSQETGNRMQVYGQGADANPKGDYLMLPDVRVVANDE